MTSEHDIYRPYSIEIQIQNSPVSLLNFKTQKMMSGFQLKTFMFITM